MRKQQSGEIVNISSMSRKFVESRGACYHAAKFAKEGLSCSLIIMKWLLLNQEPSNCRTEKQQEKPF